MNVIIIRISKVGLAKEGFQGEDRDDVMNVMIMIVVIIMNVILIRIFNVGKVS